MNNPLTDVTVELVGTDGNAFGILAKVSKALRQNGYAHLVDDYKKDAMSGDYDHLLQTTMRYVSVV